MIPVMITHSAGSLWFPALYEDDSEPLMEILKQAGEESTLVISLRLIYKSYDARLVDIHSIYFYSVDSEDFVRWDSKGRKLGYDDKR